MADIPAGGEMDPSAAQPLDATADESTNISTVEQPHLGAGG